MTLQLLLNYRLLPRLVRMRSLQHGRRVILHGTMLVQPDLLLQGQLVGSLELEIVILLYSRLHIQWPVGTNYRVCHQCPRSRGVQLRATMPAMTEGPVIKFALGKLLTKKSASFQLWYFCALF